MNTLLDSTSALTTLDVFLIVCSVVVLGVGVYLIFTLRRVSHITKVADDIAKVVENLTKSLQILEKVPLETVQKVVDKIPRKSGKKK